MQHVPAVNTVTILLLSSFWRRFGRLLQPDIVNFNPVPVAASLMDPTVGLCLLAPEMSGLLQAAKLYVTQHALTEAQQVTDNSQSSTASSSTSSVSIPELQFLTAKMTNIHVQNTQGPSLQQQLDKYGT